MGDGSTDEALEAFNNFRSLHGFPKHELVNKLLVCLSYSSDHHSLRKAYELMLVALYQKCNLLHHDSLTRLALALARAQMPVPASTVLRVILEKFKLPSVDTLNILFSHLVKTQTGCYLASEVLVEICEYCLCCKLDGKSQKQVKLMNPSTIMFNLVLNSCLQFGSMLKAQRIIELMSQVGVVADANTIVIIARIYEMIGQRDELKKLQGHIDAVSSVLLNRHYQQFYDSLLSLHFKFNDLDAAAELVLNLYRQPKPIQAPGESFARSSELQNQCLFQIGSSNLKTGSKIVVDPGELPKDLVVDTKIHSGFVLFIDGKLVPSYRAFAVLINGYVKERKVSKLSNLLINIQKEGDSKEASLCSDVIDACIQIGWLETAHDILDDLESAAIPARADTYESLLRAYCKESMLEESKLLLKQMRTAGHIDNLSDENFVLLEDRVVNSLNKRTAASSGNSCLVALLNREIKDKGVTSSMVYEFNTSVQFFCKAKMMDDALKTFKRMQERGIQPTVQTFSHLVNGYSSMKMYRQITVLWGEIRRRLESKVLIADRDLLDSLLSNFLIGGYFERVMELVNYMLKNSIYTDKWKYKREFLKLHKDLYRSLRASGARTDAQSKRIEYVRAFRRWAGVDKKL